jgi:hypothetical protein
MKLSVQRDSDKLLVGNVMTNIDIAQIEEAVRSGQSITTDHMHLLCDALPDRYTCRQEERGYGFHTGQVIYSLRWVMYMTEEKRASYVEVPDWGEKSMVKFYAVDLVPEYELPLRERLRSAWHYLKVKARIQR